MASRPVVLCLLDKGTHRHRLGISLINVILPQLGVSLNDDIYHVLYQPQSPCKPRSQRQNKLFHDSDGVVLPSKEFLDKRVVNFFDA